ncbi:MAG: hypothetical protein ACI8QC_004389 [Planctomycetota bacterium]|jgi:hypothetical protein
MARLFVLSGPDLGKVHTLDEGAGPWTLGRGTHVDVTLVGGAISREHARLERLDGGWSISDLGSSNGTRVEGKKVSEAWVVDGQELKLGDVELRFRADEGAASAPEPAARPAVLAEPVVEDADEAEPEDSFGLELEGDWDEQAAPARAPVTPAPVHVQEPARALTAAEQARAAIAASAVPRGANKTVGGGRVLQYQASGQRQGMFSVDLSQQPAVVRYALYLLLVAIMGGLAFGAFKLTQGMRENQTVPAQGE